MAFYAIGVLHVSDSRDSSRSICVVRVGGDFGVHGCSRDRRLSGRCGCAGDYLAIVTLGFGEVVRLILSNWDSLTNGPKGLPRVGETIPPASLFGFTLSTNLHYYYLILACVLAAVWVCHRLNHSLCVGPRVGGHSRG